MAADDSVLIVDDVHKSFRLIREQAASIKSAFTGFHRARGETFWALKGVSVEVSRGSMLGIVGTNGSGKSTLLRCMAGIYRPDRGEVLAAGRIAALLELGAGFEPDLSGRDNIYMNAAILGMKRKEVDAIVDDIVDFAGLGDFIDSPINVYSSGMKSRLGFSVSAFVQPDILLADEIFAVGDAAFRKQCLERMHQMRAEGTTVVLVSHTASIVERNCDKVLWLDNGVVRQVGPPADVVGAYLEEVLREERAEVEMPEPTETGWIRAVRVVGPGGHAVTTSGASLRIEIDYESPQPVDEVQFVARIVHRGQPLRLISRSGAGLEGVRLHGRGSVELTLPTVPLPPGRYSVQVAFRGDKGQGVMVLGKATEMWAVTPQDDNPVGPEAPLRGLWSPTPTSTGATSDSNSQEAVPPSSAADPDADNSDDPLIQIEGAI